MWPIDVFGGFSGVFIVVCGVGRFGTLCFVWSKFCYILILILFVGGIGIVLRTWRSQGYPGDEV